MRFPMCAALALAAGVAATAASALDLKTAGDPAEYPPLDYAGMVFVDSRGCMYQRMVQTNEDWIPTMASATQVECGHTPTFSGAYAQPGLAMTASTSDRMVVADRYPAATSRGPISPESGFPVPPGYKVAWEDGRLNPLRGLPSAAK